LLSPDRAAKLLAVLVHDRGGRRQPNADGTALVDEGALCGDPPDTSSGVNIDAIAITSHGALFGVPGLSLTRQAAADNQG
jgi:hypothetical protein